MADEFTGMVKEAISNPSGEENRWESKTKAIHTALMAAGMTPGLGNIADVADALLYSLEGEFGQAALSAASIIPFAGQLVAAKRTAKIVKRGADSAVSSKPFDKFLQSESGNVITKDLIIDGKAAGYIQGKITPMGISVNLISIDKKYQRLGFGTDLYKSLQKETTGLVYSHGWQQNPETAAKVWKSLVKSDVAEMIPSEMEPIYFLKKEGVNIKDLLKGATNLP